MALITEDQVKEAEARLEKARSKGRTSSEAIKAAEHFEELRRSWRQQEVDAGRRGVEAGVGATEEEETD